MTTGKLAYRRLLTGAVAVASTATLAIVVPAHAATTRYEAEAATISQGTVDADHAGFTGTGFVNYDNAAGSAVEFTVPAAEAQNVTLTFRYANGTTTDRPLDVTVNGARAATGVAFNGTGSWTTWQTRNVTAGLAAGENRIRATATTANGGPNLDSLSVDGATTPPPPTGTDRSSAVVASTMARETPAQFGGWGYIQALTLWGFYLNYQRTHNPKIIAYIRAWADRFVKSDGSIDQSFGNLDSMQGGNVLLLLYKETGATRYRTAAQKIRNRLKTYPRTGDGGWWHSTSASRKNQLWGDGVFMVLPQLIRYGQWVGDTTSWGSQRPACRVRISIRQGAGRAAGGVTTQTSPIG